MSALFKRRAKGLGKGPAKMDRREAFRRAAARVEGELHEGEKPAKDRVLLRHGPWRIWLDTYTVYTGQVVITYTRARAYFPGWRELKLKVRRRHALDRLVTALGWSSPPPVSRALLEECVVKGKPSARLPSLFSGQGLTEALLRLPSSSRSLEVKRPSRKSRKEHGEDAGVAVCQTTGVVTDPDQLVAMMEVVRETLDALERVGEARREPTDAGDAYGEET